MLVVGDSITERSGGSTLCGEQIYNAGVSAAKLEDLASMVPVLVRTIRPQSVIIALGTNDAARTTQTDTGKWTAEHMDVMGKLGSLPIKLVSIPTAQLLRIDASDVQRKNSALARVADHRATLAPPITVSTYDGIHPDRSGAAVWAANISAHCPARTP